MTKATYLEVHSSRALPALLVAMAVITPCLASPVSGGMSAGTDGVPVAVDSVFVPVAILGGHRPADQTNAWFGYSVAASGDTLVVGAPSSNVVPNQGPGAAYVFVRTGSTWTPQQKLTASDGAAHDSFGYSVSISGDTLVVGADFNDSLPGSGREGAAYVFVRSGTTWTEQQKLTAPDGAGLDLFGAAVSVSGNTAAVGGFWHDAPGGGNEGAAYVFTRSGAAWTLQQEILAPDATPFDTFGCSLALSGGTLVVGAVGDNGDGGSVYVFVRSGTTWTEQQKIPATGGPFFGGSVSLSGDSMVVGASGYGTKDIENQGAAFVFKRSGATWTEQQMLLASDPTQQAAFGHSVSISGDTVVAGAPVAQIPDEVQAGAMYVFSRSGTTWTERQKLSATDGRFLDSFGFAVAVFRDTAASGAVQDDTSGGVDAGSVYVFHKEHTDPSAEEADGWASADQWMVPILDRGQKRKTALP